MVRLVPPPAVARPWDAWLQEAEACIRAGGSWVGSYAQILQWAAAKLEIASARDRARSAAEGWNTPEGLLGRWARLHRFDWSVTGDRMVLAARTRPAKKATPEPQGARGLFDENSSGN